MFPEVYAGEFTVTLSKREFNLDAGRLRVALLRDTDHPEPGAVVIAFNPSSERSQTCYVSFDGFIVEAAGELIKAPDSELIEAAELLWDRIASRNDRYVPDVIIDGLRGVRAWRVVR